jgi:hypothetical protein
MENTTLTPAEQEQLKSLLDKKQAEVDARMKLFNEKLSELMKEFDVSITTQVMFIPNNK